MVKVEEVPQLVGKRTRVARIMRTTVVDDHSLAGRRCGECALSTEGPRAVRQIRHKIRVDRVGNRIRVSKLIDLRLRIGAVVKAVTVDEASCSRLKELSAGRKPAAVRVRKRRI